MGSRERQFECTNCGATVLVEFGNYSGGPLADHDFAKRPARGKEYSNQAEIVGLVGPASEIQVAAVGYWRQGGFDKLIS